ncbi:MAG: response regulator transcription factor [Spirochaetia bacterium]|nr:response regulator transcription factor [Spirochaetia bacterium]
MRVLIVEDDKYISQYIAKGLGQIGYSADRVETAEDALSVLENTNYDVAIIDLMLPGISGEQLIKNMRTKGWSIPVIILSAKGEVSDKVRGLQVGADDYLTKPFSFTELAARINALHRRLLGKENEPVYRVADLEIDTHKRQVYRSNKLIELRPREYALLEILMENKGQTLPKAIILEHIWSFYFDPQTNVLDVLMHRLRKKVDEPFDKRLIHTVRGVGYVLRDEEESFDKD